MSNRDLVHSTLGRVAIVPQTQTNADTAIVGEILDTLGFDSLALFIGTGTLTDVNATFAVLVEHGDAANLSDAAAVPDSVLLGNSSTGQEASAGFDFSDDKACRVIGYRVATGKRYVRLTITPSGNDSGAAPVCAIAVFGHGSRSPASINP